MVGERLLAGAGLRDDWYARREGWLPTARLGAVAQGLGVEQGQALQHAADARPLVLRHGLAGLAFGVGFGWTEPPAALADEAAISPEAQNRFEMNAAELGLPGVGNSDAHVLEGIGTGFTSFAGHTAADYRSALLAGDVTAEGAHWTSGHNVDVYRRQLRAKLRHLWQTVRPGDRDWR